MFSKVNYHVLFIWLLASLSTAQTCSWSGHCIGATCSTFNDCSDNLVCTSSQCRVPNTSIPPFKLSFTYWDHVWHDFAPEGCKPADCAHWNAEHHVPSILLQGDHFNVGTNNIEISVYKFANLNTPVWTTVVSGLARPGHPGGSFELKTYLLNLRKKDPNAPANAYIKAYDRLSGKTSNWIYFAYTDDWTKVV